MQTKVSEIPVEQSILLRRLCKTPRRTWRHVKKVIGDRFDTVIVVKFAGHEVAAADAAGYLAVFSDLCMLQARSQGRDDLPAPAVVRLVHGDWWMELAAVLGALGGAAGVAGFVLQIIDRRKLAVPARLVAQVVCRNGSRAGYEGQTVEDCAEVDKVGGYSVDNVYDALHGRVSFIEEYTKDGRVIRYEWDVDTTDEHVGERRRT